MQTTTLSPATILRTKLISLLHGALTGSMPNAAEYMHEMLRAAEERRDRPAASLIRLALVHAEK